MHPVASTLFVTLMLLLAATAAPRPAAAVDDPVLELRGAWYRIVRPYRYVEARRFESGWNRGADVEVAAGRVRSPVAGVVRFAGSVAGRSVVTVLSRIEGQPAVVTFTGLGVVSVRSGATVGVGDVVGRGSVVHIGAYDPARRSRYLPVAGEEQRVAPAAAAGSGAGDRAGGSPIADGIADRLHAAILGRVRLPRIEVGAPAFGSPGSKAGVARTGAAGDGSDADGVATGAGARAPDRRGDLPARATALAGRQLRMIGLDLGIGSMSAVATSDSAERGPTMSLATPWRASASPDRARSAHDAGRAAAVKIPGPARGGRDFSAHDVGLPGSPRRPEPAPASVVPVDDTPVGVEDVRMSTARDATVEVDGVERGVWLVVLAGLALLLALACVASRRRRRGADPDPRPRGYAHLLHHPLPLLLPHARPYAYPVVRSDGSSVLPDVALAWPARDMGTCSETESYAPDRERAREPA